MLLMVDIGNSHVVIGCMQEDGSVSALFRIVSDLKKTEDEYAASLQMILTHNGIDTAAFSGAVLCSVVPTLTEVFRQTVETVTGCNPLIVGAGIKTGLNVVIENPSSLGADLVATAVAAMAEYPLPVIVIDMGTATTITVVDKHNRFIGGAFVPGVSLSLNALATSTSLLQKVPVETPKTCICTTTTESMQSGAVYGTASLLDGMIQRFEEELGESASVVATGGLCAKVIPHCRRKMFYDENLLLKGLYLLYQKNKRKPQ